MYIASASSVVKFHDFPTNQLTYTYQPTCKAEGPCKSLSWTKDGCWLAVVPNSGCAEIVTLKGQCKLIHTVYDVSEPTCASFQTLTKRNIAVGTRHGQVLLYDVKFKSIKARYPRVSSAITHVGFTAKDTHCYAGCATGEVLLYNQVAKNLSCTLRVPKSHSLTALKAHPQKRNFLIAGSNEGIVCVWDVNVNRVKFQSDAHNAPVTSAIFSPVSSSLVVSAGQDRGVWVYDIDTKTRISSISVENNIMSLDFLEDSLYIAMGSQNGKIHIYDTRNLQDPVYCYEAHKGAVKHLTHQNSPSDATNSNTSLNSIVSDKRSLSNEEVLASKKNTSDFFGLVAQGPSSISEVFTQPVQSPIEGGDSFMMALNLDKSTASPLAVAPPEDIPDAKISAPVTTRKLINSFTPKILLDKAKHKTSTPTFPGANFNAGLSPVVSESHSSTVPQASRVTQTQEPVNNVIENSEIKTAMEEMEAKLSYLIMHHAHQIRRMVLDLHMASLKEFIKMEDYCNTIRDEISIEPQSSREGHLMEENINLKKRVQELEKQLASLAVNQLEREIDGANHNNIN